MVLNTTTPALYDRWSERFVEYKRDNPIAVKPGVERVLEELTQRRGTHGRGYFEQSQRL